MMPPTSGIQARAAATLEGRPLEVDLVIGSGAGSGTGDTGGGRFGSAGSGMGYLHKLPAALSTPNALAQASNGLAGRLWLFSARYRSEEKLLILLSLRRKIVTLESGRGDAGKKRTDRKSTRLNSSHRT